MSVYYKGKEFRVEEKNKYLNISQVGKLIFNEVEGIDKLIDLQELSIWGNKITDIEGLDNLKNLKHLLLFDNKISKIEGLGNLSELRILDLSRN